VSQNQNVFSIRGIFRPDTEHGGASWACLLARCV
jgi:hypothetical protein